MAQTKEFYTRIMQKHDTEANWALKTDFIPYKGEIIVYDKDSTHNYARVKIGDGVTKINNLPFTLPTASSSILGGVKIGSNISISSGKISVPEATGSVKGVTLVYPAASCTTFSSDSGTVTPLAVQKGAKMFAITRPTSSTANAITRYSNTTGDVKDSKIKIEDVTNTRDTSKTANVLSIPAEGGKKMVYGYCTDQVDGTSFIGGVFDADATEFPYAQGLAIGGTSGNLLWKGSRVIDASCIGYYANKYTHPSYPAKSSGLYKITVDATGHISAATEVAKADITALGIPAQDTTYTHPTSAGNKHIPSGGSSGQFLKWSASGTATWAADNNTTYTFATGDSNGQIKITPSGGSAQNISVKGLGTAAYTASTAYATSAQGTKADNAMPKSGGTFTGNTVAYSSNRATDGGCLRNIEVRTSSATGTLQSTNKIIGIRK